MKRAANLLGCLLALILMAGLAPAAAFAGNEKQAIQLGTAPILNPTTNTTGGMTSHTPNSYLYLGVHGSPINGVC